MVMRLASIIPKEVSGHKYYYYVESKRINGKPKYFNQKYLGKAEDIRDKMCSYTTEALYSRLLQFADVLALHAVAKHIGLVDLINSVVKKRRQGTSPGEYVLVAALNRAIEPQAKTHIGTWFSETILSQITSISEESLSGQNYWNHMNINDADLQSIEEKMVKRIVETYHIDTSHLIYDATNFFTYIDTKQDSELAKLGHCKAKRNDLKIVGLSMMISPDCNIPLLYDTYPGNQSDSEQFSSMLERLKTRYETIVGTKTDVTMVFDRGNNSEDNIDLLESEDLSLHYVGGLKSNQCRELYKIPQTEFTELMGDFGGAKAYRCRGKYYNREMTVVVVYNQNLYDGQMQGIQGHIGKCTEELSKLQRRLCARAGGRIKGGKAPTEESVQKQAQEILKAEYMKEIFNIEVIPYTKAPILKFELNEGALHNIQNSILGKTVLFTNRHEWKNEEIVSAYRSAWHVEQAFHQLKDTKHIAVRPMYHWKDQMIKMHIFYCVVSYRLCCLLRKELQAEGIYESIGTILNSLHKVKKVITVLANKNMDIIRSLTVGNDLAEFIVKKYDFKEKYLKL
jgi:transposase